MKHTSPASARELQLCGASLAREVHFRSSSSKIGTLHRPLDLPYKGAIFRACVLRVLGLRYRVAIFELELWKCTSRTRVALQSCDLELRKCTSRTRLVLQNLRVLSWGCGSVVCVLDLCYKGASFELGLRKCSLRTRLVLQRCGFRAGAVEVCFAY